MTIPEYLENINKRFKTGISSEHTYRGESLTGGLTYPITWSSSGPLLKVTIDYSLNGGMTWLNVISEIPDSGSYAWTIPRRPTTSGRVRVRNGRPGARPGNCSRYPAL